MAIKAVLFDLDGTLLPMDMNAFMKIYFGGLSKALAPYGYEPKSLIDAVWAGDDDVLRGVLNAYRKSGRTDVKAMSGGGGSQYIIGLIRNNDPVVKFTITYPPKMIYNAAMEALKLDNSSKGEGKLVYAPTDVVNAQNAKDHYFPDSAY